MIAEQAMVRETHSKELPANYLPNIYSNSAPEQGQLLRLIVAEGLSVQAATRCSTPFRVRCARRYALGQAAGEQPEGPQAPPRPHPQAELCHRRARSPRCITCLAN